jgi:phage shock protein E
MSFLKSLFGAGPDHTEAVRAALAQDGVILDVRSPGEFAGGHVPGARNVPHTSIAGALNRLDASKPVILYCRSGARSGLAASILRGAGFRDVIDVGPMGRFPRAALDN